MLSRFLQSHSYIAQNMKNHQTHRQRHTHSNKQINRQKARTAWDSTVMMIYHRVWNAILFQVWFVEFIESNRIRIKVQNKQQNWIIRRHFIYQNKHPLPLWHTHPNQTLHNFNIRIVVPFHDMHIYTRIVLVYIVVFFFFFIYILSILFEYQITSW